MIEVKHCNGCGEETPLEFVDDLQGSFCSNCILGLEEEKKVAEVNEENRINRICRKCGKRANLFQDEDHSVTLCYKCSMDIVVTKTCEACGKVFQANPGHINNCGCR
jgi:hypothetical protein